MKRLLIVFLIILISVSTLACAEEKVNEDTLDPQGAATRAQIAAIFQRFMENITG